MRRIEGERRGNEDEETKENIASNNLLELQNIFVLFES